ncbi:MAG TPA: MFS transporter, partial [Solirubrobacter sp.]|nr:MFS transporter [Solirubrobacter sp.]
VVLAPRAGRLVDRVETRRLLLVVSLAQAVVAAGLVFAGGLASILALSALLGAGAAIAGPAEAALVPATVREDALAKANGWVESARYLGFTAGPLLAGVLIAAGGVRLGLAVNAASFVAVALAAALIRTRRVPAAPAARAVAGEGGGLKLLFGDRVLRVTIGAAVAALLFISASMTVEVFYVRDVVGAGPTGFSLVFAGWTGGMVLGALGIASKVRAPLAVAGLAALALQGAGMAAAALWPVLVWVIAGYFVGGVGHGVKNVLLRTLIGQRVPAAAHGRAFAAYGAARNSAELGALGLGGVLVGVLGAQPALLLAGLGPVVAGAVGLALLAYRPSSSAALSRSTARATSGGSSSRSSSARQAAGSNIG